MRKIAFAHEEYYHIYNRGVEKRDVFLDRGDYERFLFLLFASNDTYPLLNSQFHYRGLASIETYQRERKLLVDILCFCLMPNHFHFILKQREEGGISTFMQKLGTGYTMYFNIKRKRSGSLFQGTFKAKHIHVEEYLAHLTRYIHLNPLDLFEPTWKERGITDFQKAYEFIAQYRWSSYCDYIGEQRFHRIISRGLVSELFPNPQEYKQLTKEWTTRDLYDIHDYTIEA